MNQLPKLPKYKMIEKFNHFDFNYGKYAKEELYDHVIASLESEIEGNADEYISEERSTNS